MGGASGDEFAVNSLITYATGVPIVPPLRQKETVTLNRFIITQVKGGFRTRNQIKSISTLIDKIYKSLIRPFN